MWARFFAPVQTGPGAHPASCTMDKGSFQGVKSGRGVTLTPHPLLVPLVKISTGERSAAARLLRSWVRIPPGAWIFVCCECRVLSVRGLCYELITRPEESYRLCCVVVCDLETSRMGAPYIYDISHLRVKDNDWFL